MIKLVHKVKGGINMLKEYKVMNERVYKVTAVDEDGYEMDFFIKGEDSNHAQDKFIKLAQFNDSGLTYKSIKEINII